ncbi:MAG: LysR family transcriptional regulator [Alphaproteobacteria bacterium]|nr:LysR family transcriptional regulator [Alphaproteobacteria bacterium]
MQATDWDDMRFVLAVGRTQSYAAAARQLRVNESTVARRVAQFERHLSARLFERSDGILQPTDAGAETIARAERIELEVQATEGRLAGINDRAAGSVRVTAACLFTNHILVPALPRLLNKHPLLRVELVADGRDLSLTNREADVAVRLARPESDSRAIAKRVGKLSYAVYASTSQADEALPWIAYDDRLRDLPQAKWIADEMARDGAAKPQLLINDAETLLKCLVLGLGKSLLPVEVGDRTRGLARVSDGSKPMAREIWLLVHPELRDLTRVKAVMNWLQETTRKLT